MKKILFTLIAVAVATQIFSQAKLIEKVTRKPGELTIPYEKYRLPNGLTLIIHEDHSDPIVHVDVTYHVGSAREIAGKSGFAHFFEHMMFQGSKHVADDEHFKIVSNAGGTLNGTTNRDRTNYFETLPKNQLEVALWLEADRMGFLLDSVTQQKFEIQRSTVKNERGQNYDNRPYGLVNETVSRALYPQGHPYSWLTIGYIEHLNAVDVNDLKQFFLKWYGPNNATLTVGGDVEISTVVRMAEKYFGPIPSSPAISKLNLPAVQLNETRYISGADNIRFPLIQRTYPTVKFYTADEPALDILAAILSEGKSSLFYKNFIKNQVANSAMIYNYTSEQSGEFVISVRAFPNQKLSDVDAMIDKSLSQFEMAGVTETDLVKAKAKIEKDFIGRLESVAGKVSQLAAFQTYTGNPNRIQLQYNDYQKVTKEDVMRVYNNYIKRKNFVALSWYPKDSENKIRKDNYTIPPPDKPAPHQPLTIKYKDPKDNFDRSIKPKAADAPFVSVPDFYSTRFENGVQVIAAKSDEIPMVNIQLIMKGGHLYDAYDPSKAGLANITARMMNEATKKFTSEQFGDELDKLGSSIIVTSGSESSIVYVSTLKKNLQPTLDLMYERLMNPNFTPEDFDRIKKQTLESIANSYTQANLIADKNYARLIYGYSNIKGIPNEGMQNTVKSITLSDVENFYAKFYAPDLAQLIIVGDIDLSVIPQYFQFLQNWQPKNITMPEITYNSGYDKNKIYFIDKEGAAQSEIRIGYLSLPYDATGDYYRCGVMNYSLGGAFNSRINYTLREEKGWTYGARSRFSVTQYTGPFTISGGFRKDATDSTITEIFRQMNGYKEEVKQEELDFTKNSLSQSEALKYETLNQKAGFIGNILEYDLSRDYTMQQYKILQTMTLDDMKRLTNTYLPTDKMYILIVGDKKTCFEKLSKLGYPVIELDKDGNVKI